MGNSCEALIKVLSRRILLGGKFMLASSNVMDYWLSTAVRVYLYKTMQSRPKPVKCAISNGFWEETGEFGQNASPPVSRTLLIISLILQSYIFLNSGARLN